uniref:Uncharacterized protein n=1 Tax=viral metagenome TaxID=1070528 RepID=A0A6M3LB14_9ZZZZ
MTTPINVIVNGHSIIHEMDNVSITHNAGEFCQQVDLKFVSQTVWEQCDPKVNKGQLVIKVVIGATTYQFLCEERDTIVEPKGVVFSVWGRSKQALLAVPYSTTITDTEESSHPWQTGNTTISEVLAYVLTYCSYGVTVNWNVPGFETTIIYQDTLSANDASPIEIISMLAEAVGAILAPQIDGSLSIEPYSVEAQTPVALYNDYDDIVQLSETTEHNTGYNVVTVYGYDSSPSDSVESFLAVVAVDEDATNYPGRDHLVKVYYYHSKGDNPIVQFSYTYGVIEGASDEFPTPITEEVTEVVDLYWGIGNTSYIDIDGNSEVTGDTTIPYATTSYTYTVYYKKYYLRSSILGENDAFFYFEDKSAYQLYSYTISGVSRDVYDGIEMKWSDGIVTGMGKSAVGAYVGVDLYNPAGIAVVDKGNTSGDSMSQYRWDIQPSITDQLTFVDGEAILSYPFKRLESFTWRSPIRYPVSYEVGSKKIKCNRLVDNTDWYRATASITYRTEYDTYRFFVSTCYEGNNLDVWFILEGSDDLKVLGGHWSSQGVSGFGSIVVQSIYTNGNAMLRAIIELDGIYKGYTENDGLLVIPNVNTGTHTITWSKEGYETVEQTVNITFSDFIVRT